MKQRRLYNYIISAIFHVLLFSAFFYLPVAATPSEENAVEVGIGFGFGNGTGGGGMGMDLTEPGGNESAAEEKTNEDVKPAKEITQSAMAKSDDEVKISGKGKKADSKKEALGGSGSGTGSGIGNGSGSGFGYDIEWGGGGRRRIYNYSLPEYPAGVNKELDIRIRFTILPDGTVGRVFLLTKGDTRLENSALNSLRQWRFEPLRSQQPQVEQTAVIVFPYRLQ
ncbi:MAG: energy transducer TonB [Ignavibacteria bacterium]|nr:energy transducer TonB [Ignavibacteria bacterium]